MANDSRVNLKMLFEILSDKEIEELKERAIRQRNFYAVNLLQWEAYERSRPMAKPPWASKGASLCKLDRPAQAASWIPVPRRVSCSRSSTSALWLFTTAERMATA
jgi:hypothetical protein